MEKQNVSPEDSQKMSVKQQKYELKMLLEELRKDKRIVEKFLDQAVPDFLLARLTALRKDLAGIAQNIRQRQSNLSFQERTELKNIQWLQKSFSRLRSLKYWQLLKILHKFPTHLQIGIDEHLGQYLTDHPTAQDLKRRIIIARYVAERTSLQRLLTDCYILSSLRDLQIEEITRLKTGESPIAHSLKLEEEFGIIPSHFLLEKRLGGDNRIGIFKGTDLSNDMPIVIKYITQSGQGGSLSESQIRSMDTAEARRRFEREAHAFEKLEKHRQSKEKEMLKILNDAKQKIEEGTQEENYDKMREGFELFKKGELLCDRHFVKAYCLATGRLHRFSTNDKGFFVRQAGENVGFMVMEYIQGTNLEDLIARHREEKTPMPIPSVVSILTGILQALDYCHEEGIIHRDIRPPNILLTEDLKVRLTNLGLAKVEDMTQLTAQGALIGTPGYAAPEGFAQGADYKKDFSHLVNATDYRFDIYSLGCVAYEMLVGRPPFMSNEKDPNKRDQELILKHFQEEPFPPKHFRADIPDAINQIVMTMLAKKPQERFRSAYDALVTIKASGSGSGDFIHKILQSIGGSKKKKRYGPRLPPWHKIAVIAAIAIAVIAAGYGVAVWYSGDGTDPARAEAEEVLAELEKRHQELYRYWQQDKERKDIYQKQYPSQQGYPILGTDIGKFLKKMEEEISGLSSVIDGERKRMSEGPCAEILERVRKYRDSFPYQETIEIHNRFGDKLHSKEGLARQIMKTREEERKVQELARLLKTYLYGAEEKFALIDEKRAILEQRYPANKGYYPIQPEDVGKLEKFRQEVGDIGVAVSKVNQALLEDDLSQAQKLLEPYRAFSLSALGKLSDVDENVSDVLESCKKLYQDREQKRTILRGSLLLDDRLARIQEYLPPAREDLANLSALSLPIKREGMSDPEALFRDAELEMQNLRSKRREIENLKPEEAVRQLTPYLDGKISTVGDQLRLFHERAGDQVRIAQISGQEQQVQKQVLEILIDAKGSLSGITGSYSKWRQEWETLRQEYPDHKSLTKNTIEKYEKEKSAIETALASVIETAEKELEGHNLSGAHRVLSGKKAQLAEAKSFADKLEKDMEVVRQTLAKARKDQKQRETKDRCARTLLKVEKYATLLSQHVTPLQKDIAQLKDLYPASGGYPQISPESQKNLDKAEEDLREYREVIGKAKSELQKKQVSAAFRLLEKYEGANMNSPGAEEFQNIQEDIYQTREAAKEYGESKRHTGEIDSLLTEIKGREQELRATVPALREKVDEFAGHLDRVKIDHPDPEIKKHLYQAELEVQQLQSLITEGEKLAMERNYQEALSILQPYSQKSNADISILPQMRITNTSYSRLLQVLRDPKKTEEMLRQKEAEARRKAMLKKLERSPGKWYQKLQDAMQRYQAMEESILDSIPAKDTGSSHIYERLEENWGKIKEYPALMAELKELMLKLQQQGRTLPQEAENYSEGKLVEYAKSESIEIDVTQELAEISKAIDDIQVQVRSRLVEEETLRSLLQALNSVVRKFEEDYRRVNGELIHRTKVK